MPITRERNDLDKKPTWYLFLFANVVILLGCAITFAMFWKNPDNVKNTIKNFYPTIFCNIIAIVLACVFLFLEAKYTMPQAVHFRKKWLWWYLSAIIIFLLAIIFNFTFIIVFVDNFFKPSSSIYKNSKPLIAYMVVTIFLTLLSIGIQRFSRYKIDLDIYKRKHGEIPKKDEIEKVIAHANASAEQEVKNETSKVEKMVDSEQETQDSSQMASSGLLDTITKDAKHE